MKWRILVTILYLFNVYSNEVSRELSLHPHWLKVLHYNQTFFGNYESRADAPKFFFHEKGKTDPYLELQASLEAFKKDPKQTCMFPARAIVMRKTLGLEFPKVKCKELDEWFSKLAVEGLSLVFASNYPNNPSSTFGHTLIKLNSRATSRIQANGGSHSKAHDLLNYFVSYAAITAETPGVGYAVKGIFGGYQGQFVIGPYYLKVNEYNEGESRDLWEYQLTFTQDEIDLLVYHIWELGNNTHFDYYFFDENCSMMMLALLEVARPSLDLVSKHKYYLIPIDSVRHIVEEDGVLESVQMRKSLHSRLRENINSLSENEREDLWKILSKEKSLESVDSPNVFNSALKYYFYRQMKQSNFLNDEDKKFKRELLLRRSKLPALKSVDKIDENPTAIPDGSHGTTRIGVAGGEEQGETFGEFEFRVSLHDHLNIDDGFAPHSELEIFKFRGKYRDEFGSGKFQVSEVTFMKVSSLIPIDEFQKPVSWSVNMDYYTPYDLGCYHCQAFRIEGAGGFSFGNDAIAYSIQPGFWIEGNKRLKNNGRIGPKVENILDIAFNRKFHLYTNYKLQWDLAQDQRQKFFHSLSVQLGYSFNRYFDLRVENNHSFRSREDSQSFHQSKMGFYYYY